MFNCERCGSSYSGKRGIGLENCPRCQLRDKVAAPLKFRLFESQPAAAGDGGPDSASPASHRPAAEEAPAREAMSHS
jgi:hypothetical protein